jgi:hypothetical protein
MPRHGYSTAVGKIAKVLQERRAEELQELFNALKAERKSRPWRLEERNNVSAASNR